MAASCAGFFFSSWNNIINRRTDAIEADVTAFEDMEITDNGDSAFTTASEQIREEVDEIVWTTAETTNYRTGPNKTYDKAGSLVKTSGMLRTGVTYNDWSRVVIDNETYYIASHNLTTEAPVATEGGQKGEYQKYALSLFMNYGWAASELDPLIKLWNRESGWNPHSHNKGSGAHGIPQAVPASKMAAFGSDYYTNGYTQIRWGLNYIRNRYGSPSRAWAHFSSSGWY